MALSPKSAPRTVMTVAVATLAHHCEETLASTRGSSFRFSAAGRQASSSRHLQQLRSSSTPHRDSAHKPGSRSLAFAFPLLTHRRRHSKLLRQGARQHRSRNMTAQQQDIEDTAVTALPAAFAGLQRGAVVALQASRRQLAHQQQQQEGAGVPGTQALWMKTMGCAHNTSDSEYMAGLLTAYGYRCVWGRTAAHRPRLAVAACADAGAVLRRLLPDAERDAAALWLINSCTVKSPRCAAAAHTRTRSCCRSACTLPPPHACAAGPRCRPQPICARITDRRRARRRQGAAGGGVRATGRPPRA